MTLPKPTRPAPPMPPIKPPAVDYRALLVRYMAEVLYQEGITYVEHPDVLTKEDAALLGELTADAVAHLAQEEKKWQ